MSQRMTIFQGGDRVIHAIITPDHVALLHPALPLLETVLHYRRRTFVAGGVLGYHEVEETVYLGDLDHRGRVCCSAGLLSRLRRTLREHGYRVHIEDQRRPGARLTVAEQVIDAVDGRGKALMQAIVREPLGQIEAASEEDVLVKMVLVARVFPRVRVVVAVATRKEARTVWQQLRTELAGEVELVLPGMVFQGKRWLVGTFGSIPRNKAGRYDLLLLPMGELAVGHKAIDMVVAMQFQRIYAFIRPQRRRDPLVQLRLEQLAGPVIHRSKKPRVGVRILILPTPPCTVALAKTALERKRTLYWSNDARNEHIAGVAKAVTGGDRPALKQFGLRNKDIRLIAEMDKARIVVLVESPEHGREILTSLPGWEMLDLVPGNLATVDNKSGKVGKRTVMTAAYAATHRIRADIVIRATGGGSSLRMKGFPPRRSKKGPHEVLVLDLNDEFSTEAKEDAQRRLKEYERQGMTVSILKGKED